MGDTLDFLKTSDSSPSEHVSRSGRVLVLCFDGTGNKFGTHNSNVVRFFYSLQKDAQKQLGYYQPGIGTYNKRQFAIGPLSWMFSKFDEAFALNIDDRIKEGYQFLMQNYREGDKICMFGFSRGAYTARALCGMLFKVGLLTPHNDQQLDFAFTVYKSTDKQTSSLSSKFKDTFSMSVDIDFLGLWDTVSSVGIIPRALPYSTCSHGVRVFRHALALDECRAQFRPMLWEGPTPTEEKFNPNPILDSRDDIDRDLWVYEPPKATDVKEVWFSGGHADVGGGSQENEEINMLSNIPLRWMIRECFQAQTGINFVGDRLKEVGLDLSNLKYNPDGDSLSCQSDIYHTNWDVTAIYNQLSHVKAWWLLELLPTLDMQQQEDGSWNLFRSRNLGRGRYLPHHSGEVNIHESVQERVNHMKSYRPSVYNWNDVKAMCNWVD